MTPQIPQISKVLLLVLYVCFQNVLEIYNEQLKKTKKQVSEISNLVMSYFQNSSRSYIVQKSLHQCSLTIRGISSLSETSPELSCDPVQNSCDTLLH